MKRGIYGLLLLAVGMSWIIILLASFPGSVDQFKLIGNNHFNPLSFFVWSKVVPIFYFIFGIFSGGWWISKGVRKIMPKQVKK